MLDIKFIRENRDLVAKGAQKKHIKFDLDGLLDLDDKRRVLLSSIEKKRAEQNVIGVKITRATEGERQNYIEAMKYLKEGLQSEEAMLKEIMQKWQAIMLQVPNLPDISVPEGETDGDNKEIKTWGEKTKFDFDAKDHIELMTKLGMVDFERGVKVHGFRGYFLVGDGARLCFAIWNYALDFFTNNKEKNRDFLPIIAPSIVRKISLYGTGHLPGDVEDFYMTQDGDVLSGTAEVPLMAFHSDETLELKDLPKKYLGFSNCYRREAGAHSKDVKALIRVHEFYKFEQLILCEAKHETSVALHEEINRNTEEFIESLGIPYRTVINCGGDLGLGQVKKYDIELWIPKEEKYREISSASYFHDFQTRRLNIRYKDEEGKLRYAHSLNSTAIPTPRILVSLVENCQEKDGSLRIPEVLVKYMGKDKILPVV
ncbi:MAG TPA: serine--tRNA ligase [Candidatus Paceibacterota bacterium]